MTKPKIIKHWETAEINPQEIARYLHGELQESDDADSDWNIHLCYKRKSPVITVKLDTELRTMHLLVNRSRKHHYLTTTLIDIEKLTFYLYAYRGEEHCDLLVKGSGSSIILSSYGHAHYFGSKKNREKTRQPYREHEPKLLPLKTYLEHRDSYFMTHLYADLREDFVNIGISEEEFKSRLESIFSKARADWYDANPDWRKEQIEKTKV